MANREALRELQTRLASRLLAARSEGMSVHWLAAEAGGGRYLFPLAHAGEIFPSTSVQTAPYTKPWFMGVANLRGGLCGVVDLAHYLAIDGLGVRTESNPTEANLLTFNAAIELNCALLVDRLVGLRGSDAFSVATAPLQEAPPYFGKTYTDLAGLKWQELNLQALSQSPSFLSISA